ncbi:MAG: Kelch repeat-containing protein [Planctomycetota bacterium]
MKTQKTTHNRKHDSIWMLAILMLNGLLCISSVSLGAAGTWKERAPMPTARLGLATAVVNGKIYAIGGYTASNSARLSTVEEYDLATDTWTQKSDMPTARCWLSASTVDGKIYAIGGHRVAGAAGLSTVEIYDPATDTWTQKADMPMGMVYHSSAVVDQKIYTIGGILQVGTPQLGTVVYDPLTDTWTTKAKAGKAGMSSTAVVDGKIYLLGGTTYPTASLTRVEAYDPVMDTWTTKADMPTARMGLSASTVNGKIYTIGGRTSNAGTTVSTVEVYDPVTDAWTTEAEMPTSRWGISASVINGKIYTFGGSEMAPPPHPAVATVEEYDPNPLVVDFNGDGIVDCADICMMVEYWHTDEAFYDIAPAPFGDGIVDVQDMILLSEHLFEEVFPIELLAYWKVDETEGIVAYDSAGQNDAALIGDPTWQPNTGRVGGALALDGIDDSAFAQFVLNPSDGPFSVLTWIEGGVPGQTVISQVDGADWLGTDPLDGASMTALAGSGRSGGPLLSQTVITDGNWHRIGLVWDGLNRTLYVDDVPVAQDTQTGLSGSAGGLNIGCGTSFEPNSFWSGLIDDVRIYNRALSADEIAVTAR